MVLVLFMWQIDILIKLLHGNISKVTIKKEKRSRRYNSQTVEGKKYENKQKYSISPKKGKSIDKAYKNL